MNYSENDLGRMVICKSSYPSHPREIGSIPKFIKARRTTLKLSLQQVADRMDCSKAHVWDLERGESCNPTLSIVLRLCDALECSIGELLGINETEQTLTDGERALVSAHRKIFKHYS